MEAKIDRKEIKNELKMGRHLDIDFSLILMVWGRQVGVENRTKIEKNDPKMHLEGVEGFLTVYWVVLGPPGGFLGRLGRVLGRAALREPARRGCGAGATRAPTASWCPQEPPVSKNTSIQDTSTG